MEGLSTSSISFVLLLVLVGSVLVCSVPGGRAAPAWAVVVSSRGYVLGGFLDAADLYMCGYLYDLSNGKYVPRPFIARYNVMSGKLEWFKVIGDAKGWAYDVLVRDGRVLVSGFLAPSEGFVLCLNSDGDFLWGYVTQSPLYGLLSLESCVLAYGRGQLILLNWSGEVIKASLIEVRNAAGKWVPADVWSAQYISGRIYAVGYQRNLLSAEKKFGRGFDGHLICLGRDLEVVWAVGFGSKEFNDYFRYVYSGNDRLYVCGFNQVYSGDKVVDENIVLVEFDLDGTPRWAKLIDCGGYDHASAVRVIGGDVYIAGSTDGRGAGSNDFAIVRIHEDKGGAELWTIGGSMGDFCWGAFLAKDGVLVYGKTATWTLEGKGEYPIAIYWPLGGVGEIAWENVDWETVKVKAYTDSAVLSYKLVVSRLLARCRSPSYYKHVFNIVDREPALVLARGEMAAALKTTRGEATPSPTSLFSPLTITMELAVAALALVIIAAAIFATKRIRGADRLLRHPLRATQQCS